MFITRYTIIPDRHVYNPLNVSQLRSWICRICNIALPRTLYQCSAVQGTSGHVTKAIMSRVARYAVIHSNLLHNFYRRCPYIILLLKTSVLLNYSTFLYTPSQIPSVCHSFCCTITCRYFPAHLLRVEWPIRSDVMIFDNKFWSLVSFPYSFITNKPLRTRLNVFKPSGSALRV